MTNITVSRRFAEYSLSFNIFSDKINIPKGIISYLNFQDVSLSTFSFL